MDSEARSPFLSGTKIQFAFDSTSLGYLKTCPRLYQYHMIDGWQSKDESVHLYFGIQYHQALQDYDVSRAAGISHEDALHDVVRALLERTDGWRSDHKTKNRRCLLRTVIWYLEEFRHDPAKTVQMEEGKPAVEVSFSFELDYGPNAVRAVDYGDDPDIVNHFSQPYLLCGHLDKVVDFNDEVMGIDHKTTTTTPSAYYFNQFSPNNQMSLYTVAYQIVFGNNIRGIIINAAQVGVDFSRFARGITYRTQDQLTEWLEDLKYWLSQAEYFATTNRWPMNDTSCDKFGGCKFRDICSKSPSSREAFLKSNYERGEIWNPLKPR